MLAGKQSVNQDNEIYRFLSFCHKTSTSSTLFLFRYLQWAPEERERVPRLQMGRAQILILLPAQIPIFMWTGQTVKTLSDCLHVEGGAWWC